MGRSLKKGPFVNAKLLRISMNECGKRKESS